MVFAHNPFVVSGMGAKAPGWDGADCCFECHEAIDGRAPSPFSRGQLQSILEHARLVTITDRLRHGFKLPDQAKHLPEKI